MFGGKKDKKKKPALVSCPFCFGEFEDVSFHLNDCVANKATARAREGKAPLQVAASAPVLNHGAVGGGRGSERDGGGGWVARTKPAVSPAVARRESAEREHADDTRAEINGERWEKVLDPAGSGEYYYWNRSTNETQWTPPEGWPAPRQPAAAPPQPPAAAHKPPAAAAAAQQPAAEVAREPAARAARPLADMASAPSNAIAASLSAPSVVAPSEAMSPRAAKKKTHGTLRRKKKEVAAFEITRDVPDSPAGGATADEAGSGAESEGDPEEQRTKIVKELLATEKYYIECLQVLMECYYEPLMKLARLNRNTDAADVNITIEQVDEMFGNMNVLIPINVKLRDALQERVDAWDEQQVVGDVFLRMAPFLKMYDKYGLNYHNATTLLDSFMKDQNFADALDQCYEKTDLNIRMGGLLIMPVQRIPRYVLLLKELRKHTPEGHPELAHLEEAIPVIEEVADYLNRNITEYENQRKFMALSEQGAADLVQPHRMLMHDGLMMDLRKKARVHLWLFNDLLVHVSENKAKNKANLVLPRHQWAMHLIWLEPTRRPDAFVLTGPNRQYEIKTASPEECAKWIQQLQKALSKHFERLSKLQDQSLQEEREANMTMENPRRFGEYTFPAGGTYKGWWDSGKMDGEGVFKFLGSVYRGSFQSNERHGRGVMQYITGDVYEGEWQNGLPSGTGTLKYANGDVYTGEWKEGKKCGKGDFTMVRGCTYSGDWKDDVPEGLGELKSCDGITYTGNWARGQRSHYGLWEDSKSGRRYEGDWEYGLRNGKGRMDYGGGHTYDGFFKDGMRQGKGRMVLPEEGTYDGQWVADRREGKGTMTYTDGRVYDGTWKMDLYHGPGTLTSEYGMIAKYNGDWMLGYRHGKGVLEMRNGDKFDGHFKEGVIHGAGILYYSNGMKLDGKWVNGKPHGKCSLVRNTSKKQKDKKESLFHGVCKNGVIYCPDRARPGVCVTYSPVLDV